jgi:hypothetical protein
VRALFALRRDSEFQVRLDGASVQEADNEIERLGRGWLSRPNRSEQLLGGEWPDDEFTILQIGLGDRDILITEREEFPVIDGKPQTPAIAVCVEHNE